MRKWLSIISAACLLLYPFATVAQDYGSQTTQTQQAPPVAQPLVREGDFAIKLAAELDLGSPPDETSAIDMLARAGVAPENGWLPDYPMTPQILGQLQSSIAKAASEGRLPMTAEQATKGLSNLAAQMNLPAPAGSGTEGPQPPAAQSNPTVVNNYYYNQGPPIVTYYPPPPYYVYLYDWVPYPVFWFGFWFPGFYICHNFTTVVVNKTVFVNKTVIVSNHVIDPATRRAARVDPVVRTGTGGVRPVTMLRTGDGGMFRSLTELRNNARMSGFSAVRPGTSFNKAPGNRVMTGGGFRSPEDRKSAEAIYSRSVERMNARRAPEGSMMRDQERRYVAPAAPGRSYSAPSRGGEDRRYYAPSQPGGRSYYAPARGGERPSVASGAPARTSSGLVMRGGHVPMRSFSSNQWHGR